MTTPEAALAPLTALLKSTRSKLDADEGLLDTYLLLEIHAGPYLLLRSIQMMLPIVHTEG